MPVTRRLYLVVRIARLPAYTHRVRWREWRECMSREMECALSLDEALTLDIKLVIVFYVDNVGQINSILTLNECE